MKHLENQRKKLQKKYLEDTEESIIKKETIRLFPNLMIGYRMFETEKERILIKRRAAFIKNLAKIYLHAKERKRYNFVHFNCGLGQLLPQAATRNISKYITRPLKTGNITNSLTSIFYYPTGTNTTSFLLR